MNTKTHPDTDVFLYLEVIKSGGRSWSYLTGAWGSAMSNQIFFQLESNQQILRSRSKIGGRIVWTQVKVREQKMLEITNMGGSHSASKSWRNAHIYRYILFSHGLGEILWCVDGV